MEYHQAGVHIDSVICFYICHFLSIVRLLRLDYFNIYFKTLNIQIMRNHYCYIGSDVC